MKTSNLADAMRPRKLRDYVGQDSVVTSITAMLKQKNLPSTILIHGMTGCGKTTLANLIGRYVNCEKGTACGKCLSCRQMDSKTNPDFLQLDMGSAGKIDNIRNLLDTLQFMPTYNKRVIVLEEAHALTKASANALLVTLENPPADTIFIMCTTEPQSMLDTVVGRCTQFAVGTVSKEDLVANMQRVLSRLDIEETDEISYVLDYIAEVSDGRVRNSLSLLQSVESVLTSGRDVKEAISLIDKADASDLSSAATKLVAGYLAMDAVEVVRAVRAAENNIIALIEKSRWILFALIGEIASANKFLSKEARATRDLLRKNKIQYTLVPCVYLQQALSEAQSKILTIGINPTVQLETSVLHLMTQIYEGKLTLKVNDEAEEDSTSRRGDVQRRKSSSR